MFGTAVVHNMNCQAIRSTIGLNIHIAMRDRLINTLDREVIVRSVAIINQEIIMIGSRYRRANLESETIGQGFQNISCRKALDQIGAANGLGLPFEAWAAEVIYQY